MSEPFTPQRAMFIFTHPDDIEFVAGGTAAVWASRGCEIIYVLTTDGNVGSHETNMTADRLIKLRRSEQRAAAKVTGAMDCIFLGGHDGLLEPTLALRKELVRLIRQYKPDTVVTGDPTDFFPRETYINHPDHRATSLSVIDAVFPAAEMPLLYPELEAERLTAHKVDNVFVRSRQDGDFFIDTSQVMEVKLEALKQHKSQFANWDPAETVKAWDAETGKRVGFKYAENYKRILLHDPLSEE